MTGFISATILKKRTCSCSTALRYGCGRAHASLRVWSQEINFVWPSIVCPRLCYKDLIKANLQHSNIHPKELEVAASDRIEYIHEEHLQVLWGTPMPTYTRRKKGEQACSRSNASTHCGLPKPQVSKSMCLPWNADANVCPQEKREKKHAAGEAPVLTVDFLNHRCPRVCASQKGLYKYLQANDGKIYDCHRWIQRTTKKDLWIMYLGMHVCLYILKHVYFLYVVYRSVCVHVCTFECMCDYYMLVCLCESDIWVYIRFTTSSKSSTFVVSPPRRKHFRLCRWCRTRCSYGRLHGVDNWILFLEHALHSVQPSAWKSPRSCKCHQSAKFVLSQTTRWKIIDLQSWIVLSIWKHTEENWQSWSWNVLKESKSQQCFW